MGSRVGKDQGWEGGGEANAAGSRRGERGGDGKEAAELGEGSSLQTKARRGRREWAAGAARHRVAPASHASSCYSTYTSHILVLLNDPPGRRGRRLRCRTRKYPHCSRRERQRRIAAGVRARRRLWASGKSGLRHRRSLLASPRTVSVGSPQSWARTDRRRRRSLQSRRLSQSRIQARV